MNAGERGERRQRRLLTRALPLLAIALVAFGAGIAVGAGGDLGAASRFGAAWERGDYAAMHDELAPDAARRYPPGRFEAAYRDAERTATIVDVEAGEAAGAEAPEGDDAAALPVDLRTRAFGRQHADLLIPLSDGLVEWSPQLVYPGLRPGEALDRRTRPPERAPILAADGTPLATGPAAARTSPLGVAASAVVGELGTPGPREEKGIEAQGFPPGTLTGASGLELAFNSQLAGRPGGQLLAVDSDGAKPTSRVLARSQPKPGQPVRTTIDPAVQRAAVTALGATYGGVAALDAQDGSVLGLAGIAFSAPQPPGSTFKVITTTAALDAGLVHPSDEFPIQTSTVVGGREIANAHDEPCGGSFARSFALSCNTVFAPLGPKLGQERMVGAAESFGFNSPPALYGREAMARIDPPASTIPNSIPTEVELGVSAIGQGQVLATPLQMASVAQTIADGGVRRPTSIVADPALAAAAAPVRVTSKETAATVRELMVGVVASGTGTAAAIPGVQVAGKTGTAELGPKPFDPAAKRGAAPEQEVDAWFTSFAPAEDPRIAVAVMVVNADGDGGTVAAPIARQVLAAGI